MLSISTTFADSMDDVSGFLDIMSEVLLLPSKPITTTKSGTAFVVASKRLRRNVNQTKRVDIVSYDGAFLYVCAEFELTLRSLIERYVERAVVQCPDYNNLPAGLRTWFPKGCATLILNIDSGRFKHVTIDDVVKGIAGSTRNRSAGIRPEVFSYSERNFKPGIIDECFSRISIEKIWQKVSRDTDIRTFLGTSTPGRVEDLARRRLEGIMDRRNDIVNRGKSYYTSSLSEVRDSAAFLKCLVGSFAQIMERQLAAL